MQKFVDVKLSALQRELDVSRMLALRQSGQDLVQHVVSELRNVHISVSEMLKELGYGPVVEETHK